MSGWIPVRLGDVLESAKRPTVIAADRLYDTLGVRWYAAGCFVKKATPVKASSMNRVAADDVVYSKLFAWKGSFGVVSDREAGALASTEFPTFRADGARLLPAYFALWASRADLWDEVDALSTGTTGNSRNRLSPEDFLDLEIDLPPLDEQGRICRAVDVAGRNLQATGRLRAARQRVYLAAREEAIEGPDWDRVPLSDVVAGITGGKSPKCFDRPPLDGEWGVLKVSAIRDGEFRPTEAKALPANLQPSPHLAVRGGDLLYSRANTAQLVGAMCRAERDHPRLMLCDKSMRVQLREGLADADYLVEAIGVMSARDQIEIAAGGTSESMKNVSQDAFLDVEIALPPITAQRVIAEQLCAMRRAVRATNLESQRIAQLRTALVEELVSGTRSVPRLSSAA